MKLKFGTRKLQAFGYSYMISVPKIWAQNHGLGRRSKIEIELDADNNLVLKPVKPVVKQQSIVH